MIKADDPREVLAFFTETLGLPVAWRVEERGVVESGGVGLGTSMSKRFGSRARRVFPRGRN